MKRLAFFAVPAALAVVALCTGWLVACPRFLTCGVFPGMASGGPFPIVTGVGLFIGSLTLAGLGRGAWLWLSGWLTVRGLPLQSPPRKLRSAARRQALKPVNCVSSDSSVAFCAGPFRPSIYVSRGLSSRLRAEELEAVLLHETYHAASRDPLRRLLARALSDVLFFAPIARWWADRQLLDSELAADRFALRRIGRRPVAGALWAAGLGPANERLVAFSGAATSRTAQLLGIPLPRSSASLELWMESAAGLLTTLALAFCLLRPLPILLR